MRCAASRSMTAVAAAPGSGPGLEDIEHEVDAAFGRALRGMTLKTLADQLQPPGPAVEVETRADSERFPEDRPAADAAELSPRDTQRD